MKQLKNRLVSKKLAYVIGATVAVTGILIVTTQMFPKIKLAKEEVKDFDAICEIKIADLRSIGVTENSNNNNEYRTVVTSRGSDETRTIEKETC